MTLAHRSTIRASSLKLGRWSLRRGLVALFLSTSPLWASSVTAPAPLVEFKHDAWSMERGAPSRINSITQTRDGFLWIGSVDGLFRFDGVTFESVRMETSGTQRLVVSSLRSAKSGALWVGLARGRGVALFRDGRLVDAQMPNPSREVNDIEEDAEGSIWVARGGRSDHTLARFRNGAWQEFGPESGLPAQPVWDLHFARDGTLWVVLANTLAYLRPGTTRFTVTDLAVTPRASLSEDIQGQIWISDSRGTRPLNGPSGRDSFFAHPNPIAGTRLLFDRNGDLWTTTWNSGVLRIRAPGQALPASSFDQRRVTSLDATAGLTSDEARALFQDREGNIWVGTELGLDLLRPASVIAEPGLPANSPTSYWLAAGRDGTVYVADARALYAISPGRNPKKVLDNDSPAEGLCPAGERGVWLFLADRVLRVEDGSVRNYAKPAKSTAYGCAEDSAGRLWMPGLRRGLYWLQGSTWQRWPEPEPSPSLPGNVALDRDGHAVVQFRERPPEGDLPFVALDAAKSNAGGIEGLLPSDVGVLVSGNRGLAIAGESSGALLSSETSPWSASVNGLAQTRDGDTWAIGDVGIVRMRSADLAAALRHPEQVPPYRIFDIHDGLNSFVQKAQGPQVVVGGDGRVWFLTRRHVMRIDPASIAPNRLPPPVLIRSVNIGDQVFAAAPRVELPAGTTTVRISFTALSLTVPERVQFSYRIVGSRHNWSTPSSQRSVLLPDLRPGDYQFEVRASNNDGLWSDEAAEVTLTIPPTFTESLGFKFGVAALTLLLLYGFYILRLRQILARIRERDRERTRERERIARDMHDTLLQSVQGLILRFQSVAERLRHDTLSYQVMNGALDRAEDVLAKGRERLQGLRQIDVSDLDSAARRLVAEIPFADTAHVTVSSMGRRRNLRPSVFDEILYIVSEALFNAARHSQASEVGVIVDYGRSWLDIDVSDNGIGLPQGNAPRSGPSAHFGLKGMRERAHRIGAQYQINSFAARGTRISLRIKARIAYAKDTG